MNAASASSDGWEYCCQAHQRKDKGQYLARTGKQVQDMVLGGHHQEFLRFACFWTGFHYLMTYGLDGIDTQYP